MLADIGRHHFAILCPCDPVGVAESVSINFPKRFWIITVYEGVARGYSILPAPAVLSCRINADDRTPDIFRSFIDMQNASFGASAITDTDIQQTIVLVARS